MIKPLDDLGAGSGAMPTDVEAYINDLNAQLWLQRAHCNEHAQALNQTTLMELSEVIAARDNAAEQLSAEASGYVDVDDVGASSCMRLA